jgi:cardiolipin synthase
MTTANKVTIARILLIPFFIVQVIYYSRTGNELYRFGALLAFALAGLGDALDGYIARHYNQRSELGAILDPLADKLLLLSSIILLCLENHHRFDRLPVGLAVTVLSRDTILVLGVGMIHYTCGKVRVRPRLSGKVATVLQMAAVLWVLLRWPAPFLRVLAIAAGLLTALSGVLYMLDGIRQLNAHPASAPTPNQESP